MKKINVEDVIAAFTAQPGIARKDLMWQACKGQKRMTVIQRELVEVKILFLQDDKGVFRFYPYKWAMDRKIPEHVRTTRKRYGKTNPKKRIDLPPFQKAPLDALFDRLLRVAA